MAATVVDCSAIMACLAPDEASPAAWQRLLIGTDLVAPGLLAWELANALRAAVRSQRLTTAQADRAASAMAALHVECEPVAIADVVTRVRHLARTHDVTAYDAAYIELAQRRHIPLATLDAGLRTAAEAAGVTLA